MFFWKHVNVPLKTHKIYIWTWNWASYGAFKLFLPSFLLPTSRWETLQTSFMSLLKSHINSINTVLNAEATDDVRSGGKTECNYLLKFCLEETWPFTIHASWQLFKELLLLIWWNTDLMHFWNLNFSTSVFLCSTGSITEVMRIKHYFSRWLWGTLLIVWFLTWHFNYVKLRLSVEI